MRVYLVIDQYDHEVGVTVFKRAEDAATLFESIVREPYRFGDDVESAIGEDFDGDYSAWDGKSASAWDGVGGWSVELYGAQVETSV